MIETTRSWLMVFLVVLLCGGIVALAKPPRDSHLSPRARNSRVKIAEEIRILTVDLVRALEEDAELRSDMENYFNFGHKGYRQDTERLAKLPKELSVNDWNHAYRIFRSRVEMKEDIDRRMSSTFPNSSRADRDTALLTSLVNKDIERAVDTWGKFLKANGVTPQTLPETLSKLKKEMEEWGAREHIDPLPDGRKNPLDWVQMSDLVNSDGGGFVTGHFEVNSGNNAKLVAEADYFLILSYIEALASDHPPKDPAFASFRKSVIDKLR